MAASKFTHSNLNSISLLDSFCESPRVTTHTPFIFVEKPDLMEGELRDNFRMDIQFEASVEKVWRAWTDPKIILQWIGSEPDNRGLDARLHVYPGGDFEIHFMSADQTEHTCYGVYREVVEFAKLSFSWRWKSEPGVESRVSISLIPDGRKTLMQFEHRGFGYQSAHDYAEGWKGTFVKLKNLLEKTEK